MAQPQTFTIRAGQDLVIDGFSLGSVGLRFEGSGMSASNLLIDQSGADTVLSFVGSNTRVRLTNFEARGLNAGNNFTQTFEFASVVSSNPTGTGLNDTISGNTRSETISGGGGNDSISGGRGNDRIFGDAGNDTVRGDQGNDTIDGGTGIDLLQGGEGNDTLQFAVDGTWPGGWAAFNAGDPGAAGTGQTISITGMNRSFDVFDGGTGTDTLRLTGGNDAVFLDDPYSSAAQSGARIRNIERIEAGEGNDVVDLTSTRFSLGAVTVDGGAGNDVIWTSAGNDSVLGGAGSDNIWGGSGRDTLVGGDGSDTIDGGRGNDLLIGGAGDDAIRGGAGVENATINVATAYGGGGQSSWAGLNLSAQNIGANGALGASSSASVGFTNDGFGASGNQASRPSIKAETGYDPINRVSETVSVAFAGDVGTATVSLSYFYGPSSSADYNKAEQAFWRILNDGAVVATGTVTATGTGNQSFTIDPPGDAVFDAIVMWAGPYVSATGAPAQGAITNDSSDFLIRAISTTATVADEAARGGNDRIIGGGGNDSIDGGSGIDTSVYSSFISDYVFSRNAGGALVVTGAGAGAVDGADTLVNVEFLEFLNGVVVPTANLGINAAPDAQNSTATGNEDTVIAGRLTATDANGDTLTYALTANGAPANGTLTLNPNGSYNYTPNANFNGTDSFTYSVSDGRGGTDTATVTLNVASVNDAPTTSGGAASGNEDAVVAGTLTGSDVDGDALSFALAPNGAPANGTVTINPNGTYSYTPNANFNGTDSFTYRVSDGQGGTTTGTISVNVSPANDAPTTSGATVAGQEDGSIAGQVTGADVDGNPLTFALGQGPANGAVTMNPDGSFSYVPATNFNGTDAFTYTVSDGNGGTTTGTVSVNVAAVNDAPTTSGGDATGAEDGTVTGTLTGSDVDGDTLSFAVAPNGAPANGSVTVNPNGTYSYTPAANFVGTDSFTYAISDGNGGTTLGTISVTVTNTNDAPTTSGATVAGQEDGSIAGQVTGADVDGNPLTFALGQGPANGAVTMNPNGSFSYVPAANFNGTDSFTYSVSDGQGGTTTGTVSVNVAAVNDAPTTSGGAASGNEDAVVAGTLTARDVDGDALSFALAPSGAPANGTVTINPNGTYSYTPNANFNGTDSFTYAVSDGQGGTTLGTISVTVSPANDAPTTSGATVAGQEDGSIAGRVTGSDVDGNPLTFALGQGPANGAVTMNPNGSFSYVPAANFNGTDSFTYSVSDGQGGTTTGTVSVNVAAVNDAPTTSGGNATGNEDTVITGTLTANDVDGDAMSFALASNGGPAHGTVTVNPNGSYSYTPNADYAGSDSFTYSVTDANGATTTSTVTLNVAPVADTPNVDVGFGSPTVNAGTSSVTVTDFAAEAGYHNSYGIYTLNASGEPVSGRIVWGDVKDHVGQSVTIPGLDAARTGFFIVPNGDNNNPGRIQDGESVGFVKGSDGKWIAVDAQGNAFAGSGGANAIFDVPALNVGGRVMVTDNGAPGNQNWEDIAAGGDRDFNDVNTNAAWASDNNGTSAYPLNVSASPSDRDGSETLAGVSLTGIPAGSVLKDPSGATVPPNSDGSYSLTPSQLGTLTLITPPGFAGALNVTATATAQDGTSYASASDSASTQVGTGNLGPITAGGIVAGAEDTATTGQLQAQDPNGDPLTFSLAQNGGPAHGTVAINPNGSYTYTPSANYNGADSFTYTVSDGNGGTATGTIVVNVASVNDAPTTSGGAASGNEDTAVTGALSASDIDGGTLSYALAPSGAPANGTVTINPNGTYSYTPAANFNGTDSFTYRVSDGQGGTVTGTVSITVSPVNDAPTTSGATVAGQEDGSIAGQVTGADVDGNPLTFALGQGPANGAVTMNPDGTFNYVPAANFNGTDAFTYTVSDGQGGTTTGTVSVNVAAVNDAPTTSGGAASGNEDTTITGQLTGADIDGDTLSFSLAPNGGPAHGTVTVNPDGSYSYVPAQGFAGNDSFTYTVSDGNGGTATASVAVNVAPVDSVLNYTVDGTWPGGWAAMNVGSPGAPGTGEIVSITGMGRTFGVYDGGAGDNTLVMANGNNALFLDDRYSPPTLNEPRLANIDTIQLGTGNQLVDLTSQQFALGDITIQGNSGDDTIWSSAGDDLITAGAGADKVYAGAGDDTAAGGSGNDAMDGASGVDTAVFSGNVSDYIFRQDTLGTITVTDTRPGAPDGRDTIANFEFLKFLDGTISADGLGINRPPVAPNVGASGTEDAATAGQLVAQDADGDPLTFALAQNGAPAHGTVSVNPDGSYTYTPAANFNGTDAFSYTVSDGRGGVSTGTVTMTVASVNDAPTAQAATGSGDEDTVIAGALSAGDVDGDQLTFALAANGGPAHGSVVVNPNGTYSYTPNANFNGTDSFTYQVGDGNGGTTTATVTLNVAAVNDAPATSGGAAAGGEDTAIYGTVTGVDIDGDALSFAVGQGPAHGTVTLNADGTYIYTPAANYFGADTFTYSVSDGKGGTATGTVSVAVAPVNDAPIVAAQSVSGNEDAVKISGRALATDVEGDALTFALAPNGAPAHGSVTFRPDGTFDYVPAPNFNGSDSFGYTVSDGNGGVTTASMTIYVAPVNDAPTAPAQTDLTGYEDTILAGTLPASDVDGDTLTYALVGQGAWAAGTVTVNPDGTFSMQFPPNGSGVGYFDYTATDPSGASTQGRIMVNVMPVNDAPWVQNVSVQVAEDDQPNGRLTFGDVDAGDVLTVTLAPGGAPAHGVVTITPGGAYHYIPNPNFNGTDSFQFAVTDSAGATTIGSFTVNVTPVNDAPVTTPMTVGGNEDTAISGQLAATDPDGDAITYYMPFGFQPTNGQLTFNPDGSFTFVPNANWNGQVEVYYHARDAQGAETAGRLYINVAAVNDAPVALTTSTATNEDTVLAGRLTASDVDGDVMTFGLAPGGGPQHGALTILPDGSYTYTPSANYNGADTFTYTVNDGKGGTTTATVAVNVAPVNDAPAAQSQTANATEDTALTGQLAATDVEGDALTYSLAAGGAPRHGTVTLNMDGSFTYVPAANYNGTDSFVYQVSDGKGGLSFAAVTLNVAAVNDAPTAGTGALTTREDTVLAGRLSASDADGDALSFSLVAGQGPAHGTLSLQPNGNYVYTPAPNFNGTDSFAYTVSDGNGGTATRTVGVSVTAVNDAPTTANSTVSGQEDTAISGRVTASDVDGDNLSFSVPASGRPAHGTVTMHADGTYTYTPSANYNGTDTFTYRVSDGKGGIAIGTVTIDVAAVNDAPVATSGPIPGIEDTLVSGRVNATDPEGQTLTFALVTGPAHGSLTFASDGAYTYAPSANYNGVDTFVFSVSDGNGGVTTVTQRIQIAAVNDAPTTSGAAVTGTSNQPIAGALTASDVDGDALAFAIAANGGPAHGTLALQPNGSYVYTPAAGFNGADSFVYTVSDGQGGLASATVSISVVGANDAPVAGNTSFTLAEDTALTGSLGVTDPEGDAFSIAMAQGPAHGAIQFGPGGTFTYTPGANYNGADSFQIMLTDAVGAARTQTISLNVTPVVDIPYLAPIHLTMTEDSGSITVPLDVINPDGLGFFVSTGVWNSPLGTYTRSDDGQSITFTPFADASGTAELSVLFWDDQGNGTYVPLTIDILPVDDGPRASVSQFYGMEESAIAGRLQAYDPDGGTIADYRLAEGPALGQVTINPDGTFVFTPPPNYFGVQTFTYIATDATGASSTLTATVNVQNSPDAPIIQSTSFTGTEDTTISGAISVFNPDDPNGAPGSSWWVWGVEGQSGNLSGGRLHLNLDGTFFFTPYEDWYGTTSVQIVAINNTGGMSDPVTVTFEITPVNDAPRLAQTGGYPTVYVDEDSSASGNLAIDPVSGQSIVSDVESPLSDLTFHLVRQAANGTVTILEDGSFIYTPNPNFHDLDTFSYMIMDPEGASVVVQDVSIYVRDVPETIDWQASYTAESNHLLSGDVGDCDSGVSFFVDRGPAHGTLTLNSDGVFEYTPNPGFVGTDRFLVTGYIMGGNQAQWISIDVFGTAEHSTAEPAGNWSLSDHVHDTVHLTTIGPEGPDTIVGFQAAEDKIDVTALFGDESLLPPDWAAHLTAQYDATAGGTLIGVSAGAGGGTPEWGVLLQGVNTTLDDLLNQGALQASQNPNT